MLKDISKLFSNGVSHATTQREIDNIRLINIIQTIAFFATLIPAISTYLIQDWTYFMVSTSSLGLISLGIYLTSIGKWEWAITLLFLLAYIAVPFLAYNIGFTGISTYILTSGVVTTLIVFKNWRVKYYLIALSILALILTLFILYNKYDSFSALYELSRIMIIPNVLVAVLVIYSLVLYINARYLSQYNELENISHVKTQLISVISHDVRAPLNNLLDIIGLAKNGNLEKDQLQDILATIEKQTRYTSELLEDLLVWTQTQTDGTLSNSSFIDLREVVNETLKGVQSEIEKKGINTCTQMLPDIKLYGDKNMIQLVLRNLLNNAIKFAAPENGLIKMSGEVLSTKSYFYMTNNGTTISEENIEKIQARKSFSTEGTNKESGNGVGLLLCHKFIELNGGKIIVEQAKNKEGTTFGFHLPTYIN